MHKLDPCLQKRIIHHNNTTQKMLDEGTIRPSLSIECIFGVHHCECDSPMVFILNKEEILFYLKNMFVQYNIETKKYQVIYEELVGTNEEIILVRNWSLVTGRMLLCVIKLVYGVPYLGILWPDENKKIQYYKLPHVQNEVIIDIDYHDKKENFYLLTTQSQTKKQSLKVMELEQTRVKVLLNASIKKTGGSIGDLSRVIVSDRHDEIYFYGVSYFRQWKISFNEKTIKQSNYRNIERSLKKETIVDYFWLRENVWDCKTALGNREWILGVVTRNKIVFVRSNELWKITQIPKYSLFLGKKKESTETTLEKSLNQIYKMKFNFQEDDQSESQIKDTIAQNTKQEKDKDQVEITCVSMPWLTYNKQVRFCASMKQGKVIIYQLLPDFNIKIMTEIPVEIKLAFPKNLSVSVDGQLILTSDQNNNPFIINQSDFNSDLEAELQPLWINGHCHNSKILTIISPELNSIMVSLDDEGGVKVWSLGEREKFLLIDTVFKGKVIDVDIHPCGFLLAVNFGLEIKVYAIVSMEFEEIVSIKTHDMCSNIKFSKTGSFITSNQKSMIKFYEPFTLMSLGSIEPESLRLQIQNCLISQNGEYIVFQCCNFHIYRNTIQFSLLSNNPENPYTSTFCHQQTQLYTCYYYDFGTIRNALNNANPIENDIFVGFTKNKYMVMYSGYGENLIAEFPVENCTINCIYVEDKILYAGTDLGCVRCYSWPILESHCLMEVSINNPKVVRLKPPQFSEDKIWMDGSGICQIHKASNKNSLIVGNSVGNLAVFSLTFFKKNKLIFEETSADRKKMIASMNDLRFSSMIELQRLKKLIDKTENDIVKIQHQCTKEKQNKQKQLENQEEEKKRTLEKRRNYYTFQRDQYIQKQEEKVCELNKIKEQKLQELDEIKVNLVEKYDKNIKYEEDLIQNLKQKLEKEKGKHKQRISNLIQRHKNDIKLMKQTYFKKIKNLQKDFEENVVGKFTPSDIKSMKIINVQEGRDQEILQQRVRVSELEQVIQQQEKALGQMQNISEINRREDEEQQKQFQLTLQSYNQQRFKNLILHSEVLKMQNQLLDKKEILNKKDEVIHLAYQEKCSYENYKQLVRGSLFKIQKVKEEAYDEYIKKESQLKNCFEQLTKQLNKNNDTKINLSRTTSKLTILSGDFSKVERIQRELLENLRELKKFLLLEGGRDDLTLKSKEDEQEHLLAKIKWLNKRFNMTCQNEKKLINLKKNNINQIIKQNQNLLEQCNQLREEGIEYDNEINHLTDKLDEANKIIELQRKLKKQKSSVFQQKQKLEGIRQMFRVELQSADDEIHQFE